MEYRETETVYIRAVITPQNQMGKVLEVTFSDGTRHWVPKEDVFPTFARRRGNRHLVYTAFPAAELAHDDCVKEIRDLQNGYRIRHDPATRFTGDLKEAGKAIFARGWEKHREMRAMRLLCSALGIPVEDEESWSERATNGQ